MSLNKNFNQVVTDFAACPALMAGTHVFQGVRRKDGQLIMVSDNEAKRFGAKIFVANEAGVWRVTKHGKAMPVASLPNVQLSFEVAAGAKCSCRHYFLNWDD